MLKWTYLPLRHKPSDKGIIHFPGGTAVSNLYPEWQLNICELFVSGIFHSFSDYGWPWVIGTTATKTTEKRDCCTNFLSCPCSKTQCGLYLWSGPVVSEVHDPRNQAWQWQRLQKRPQCHGVWCACSRDQTQRQPGVNMTWGLFQDGNLSLAF